MGSIAATPAGSALSFVFRDTILPHYVGGQRELCRYGVNDFMYREPMRYARTHGARLFGFGRSKQRNSRL